MRLLTFTSLFVALTRAEDLGDGPWQASDYDQNIDLIASQFSRDPYDGQDKRGLVIEGDFMLVSLRLSPDSLLNDHYKNVKGMFCKVDFEAHKNNPAKLPLFRDITGESVHCTEHFVSFDLREIVQECRKRDDSEESNTHAMVPKGVLFHQPKSGSSVIMNSIAASDPSSTRVISEPGILLDILTAGKKTGTSLSQEAQVELLQDAVYLLGRTTDPREENLYLKVPPSGTFYLNVMRQAFPDAKWIFSYREPDVVLQKIIGNRSFRQSCISTRKHSAVQDYIAEKNKAVLSDEALCSAVLATMLAMAFEEQERTGTGRLVNFDEEIAVNERATIVGILEDYLKLKLDEGAWLRIENQLEQKATGGLGQKWEGEDVVMIGEKVREANADFLGEEMKKRLVKIQ